MPLIALEHISKEYRGEPVLNDVSWNLERNASVGLVGDNGSGKSTLLRIMNGDIPPDAGRVYIADGVRIGYLPQEPTFTEGLSLRESLDESMHELNALSQQIQQLEAQMQQNGEGLEAILDRYALAQQKYESMGGYERENLRDTLISELGLSSLPMDGPVTSLSGGERARVAIAAMLLGQPDLLLLDEPDNHLDLTSIEWLESFLRNTHLAFVLVSHNRYLLDQAVTDTIELEGARLNSYRGNYSRYVIEREERRKTGYYSYLRHKQEAERLEHAIFLLKKWGSEDSKKRSRQARILQKQLERLGNLEKPRTEKAIRMDFDVQERSSDFVCEVRQLCKRYGDHSLFEDANFTIQSGERIALIGPNGVGKTTLLRLLLGLDTPTDGKIEYGEGLVISYFDQAMGGLNPDRSIYEEMSSDTELTVNQTRYLLVKLAFHRDDAANTIRTLSGGERNRIMLSKLVYSRANLLVLDEPTNHLDIVSVEVLEKALQQFPGTVLFASHDRYLLSRIATRLLLLDDGRVKDYPGDYESFLEQVVNRQGECLE